MVQGFTRRWLASGIAAITLLATNGLALVKFDDGHDQIFVNASVSIGYDSNIFARKDGGGDTLTTTSFGIEYARHAGYIAVNASIVWSLGQFGSNPDQNFSNPTLNLELIKSTGRTTGSFTVNAARQSSSDAVANTRTDSWTYTTGLNWKYPVIDRYSLAGDFNYGLVSYQQAPPGIYNLTSYGASLDLFYTYTSERDLIAGYSIKINDADGANSQSIDHNFTVGMSGKITSKLNGTVRAGYEIRQESATGQSFGSWSASAAVTWSVNRRLTFTGTLTKDFTTSSTDASIDSLNAALNAQYVVSAHWIVYSGIGGGESKFLSGTDTGRQDYYFTWNAGVGYNLNEHFKASLTYAFYESWSNRSASNYDRNSLTLNLSTRW
ncbi:MAG: outer membrane beta-barrel protein [Verrucomicrobia bacterium]|nr:outer membrane beta-barrel protein [Verrucomicrobiota bacterium]